MGAATLRAGPCCQAFRPSSAPHLPVCWRRANIWAGAGNGAAFPRPPCLSRHRASSPATAYCCPCHLQRRLPTHQHLLAWRIVSGQRGHCGKDVNSNGSAISTTFFSVAHPSLGGRTAYRQYVRGRITAWKTQAFMTVAAWRRDYRGDETQAPAALSSGAGDKRYTSRPPCACYVPDAAPAPRDIRRGRSCNAWRSPERRSLRWLFQPSQQIFADRRDGHRVSRQLIPSRSPRLGDDVPHCSLPTALRAVPLLFTVAVAFLLARVACHSRAFRNRTFVGVASLPTTACSPLSLLSPLIELPYLIAPYGACAHVLKP